jgi:parallel beta-helix repeat protein
MSWNGPRRLQTSADQVATTSRGRRHRIAIAALGIALAGALLPSVGATASTQSELDASVAAWGTRYNIATFDENSSRIAYSGTWRTKTFTGFFGDRIKQASSRGAKAVVTVKGSGVAWIGPKSPNRGKASVYLDGKYVKTVSMWSSRFDARAVIFATALSSDVSHTLSIVVQGTPDHPWVGLDRFIVRGAAKAVATPGGTSSSAITVTRDNTVIDGKTIVGSGSGAGIRAHGTSTNPIENLTIRNCVIRGFSVGIDLSHVKNVTIQNCVIDNSRYAGILVVSGVGGRITDNLIRKVGMSVSATYGNNAYGIALSRAASSNFTTDPRTTDFVVSGNTVEDVPLWHCFDTHAGQRITFSNNTARRCPRAFFITTDSSNYPSKSITVTGNRMEQSVQVSGGTNKKAVTLVNLQTGAVTNNYVSTTYGSPMVYDYLGVNPAGSTNVTISGQHAIP